MFELFTVPTKPRVTELVQCDTSGMIPTNHRHAAAVLTLTDSINNTLVGGSMTFIATSMDITGTL